VKVGFIVLAIGATAVGYGGCFDGETVASLIREGEAVAAFRLLERSAESCRNDPEWNYLRARAHWARGEFTPARDSIDRALALNASEPEYHRFSAFLFARVGDAEAARTAIRRSVQLRGGDEVQAAIVFGAILAQAGKTTAALAFLDSVAVEQPDNPKLLYYRALFEQSLGNLEKARGIYQRLLAVKPGDRDARRQMVLIHLDDGETERAFRAALELAAEEPSAETSFLLARAYSKLGQLRESENAARAAVEASPRVARYRRQLGLILLRSGATEAGREQMQIGTRLERAAGY